MSEIDLIPVAYRTRIFMKNWFMRLAMGLAGLVAISMVAYVYLTSLNKEVNREVSELQSRQEISNRQREELKQLYDKKTGIEGQLALLRELRGSAAAREMFQTLDRALSNGDVWFLDWEFQRAGSIVKKEEQGVNTGYFIIVQGNEDTGTNEAWKIETHMNIRGQAKDHSALSRFVRRLFEQTEIKDVRILNTTRARGREMVEFRLAIIVKNKVTSS
ncbi:MAG: hypothetical protein HKM88_01085 [Halobacteria archaeon]|nr:hypothetical protein [Halobacteria archaeon]